METQQEQIEQKKDSAVPQEKFKISVQAAIIIGSIIIAVAILIGPIKQFIGTSTGTAEVKNSDVKKEQITIQPVSNLDHIYGDQRAKIFIVEFSDTECPYCKNFHQTLHKVIDHYNGKVAWVYRHFPLDNIHPKTRTEAHATECVNEIGGNDLFWKYIDRIFTETASNNKLDLDLLPKFATDLGIDKTAFTTCMASNKFAEKIQKMQDDGEAAGLQGTPYSVVVTRDGKLIPINGNQPYDAVLKIIDPLLK